VGILSNSLAQKHESLSKISVRLLDEKSQKPIEGAHVINISQHLGTITDSIGVFEIFASVGDTLRFSSLGYETVTVPAIRFFGFLSKLTFNLRPKTYELQQANVFALTWKTFKDSVIQRVVPEEEWRDKRWIEKIFTTEQLSDLKFMGPKGIPINYTSHDEAQKLIVKDLIAKDQRVKALQDRADTLTVGQITGLQGEDLRKFYSTLSFDTDSLRSYNDYQLMLFVKRQFSLYQSKLDAPK
jgi:hypothetical protein